MVGLIFPSISPAFQWAQSPDSVFLNVKFSHKWDTPATLGCEADKVDFADRSLRFATVCASKRKNFALNLDLLRDIDAEVRAPLSLAFTVHVPTLALPPACRTAPGQCRQSAAPC